MTPRQSDLMRFLRARAMAGDVSPSFDEMARHLGISSKSGVHRLLTELGALGKINRTPNIARSIEIVGFGEYERGYRDGLATAHEQACAA